MASRSRRLYALASANRCQQAAVRKSWAYYLYAPYLLFRKLLRDEYSTGIGFKYTYNFYHYILYICLIQKTTTYNIVAAVS